METDESVRLARLRFSGLAGLAGLALAALFTFASSSELARVPLFSANTKSVASLFTLLTFIITLAVTAVGYRRFVIETDTLQELAAKMGTRRDHLLGRMSVALVMALLLTGSCLMAFFLLRETFAGAEITRWGTIFAAALYAGALAFGVAYIAVYINWSQMLLLSGAILVVGLAVAGASAAEPKWWSQSLSFLGWDSSSNLIFNGAMILAGLVVSTVASGISYELKLLTLAGRFPQRGYAILRVSLLAVGLLIVGIGLFPIRFNDVSYALHNISSHALVAVFVVLMAALGRIAPIYPRWFIRLGWMLGAACVVTVLLWAVFGAINFVFMEIALLALIAPWFFLFNRQTRQYIGGGPRLSAQAAAVDPARLRFSSRVALIGLALGLGFTFIITNASSAGMIPLFDARGNSVAGMFILLTFAITLAVTAVGYRRLTPEDEDIIEIETALGQRRSHFIGRVSVSVVLAILMALVCLIAFFVIRQAFSGAEVTRWGAIISTSLYCGALAFGVAYVAVYLDRSELLLIAGAMLVTAVIVAATNTAEPRWWERSISFLGYDPNTSLWFNISFVLTGLVVLAASTDIIYELRLLAAAGKFASRSFQLLRLALLVTAVCLVCIGLFPTGDNLIIRTLHNIAAHTVLIVFMVLMVVLDRIAPIYPRWFIRLGWILGGVCVLLIISYYVFRIINFVFMEIALIVVIAPWFFLFEQQTRLYIDSQDVDADVLKHISPASR